MRRNLILLIIPTAIAFLTWEMHNWKWIVTVILAYFLPMFTVIWVILNIRPLGYKIVKEENDTRTS